MPNGGIQPIGDAAVVGAGEVGCSIALSLALGGFLVVLVDSSHEDLRRAVDDIRITLSVLEDRGTVDGRNALYASKHILPHMSIAESIAESINGVGFAVEAVSEDLELKRSTLAELDRHCPDRTILASTTSSFEVSQLASSTTRPDRVVVTRWGNPPHLTSCVEVVPGPATSDMTIDLTTGVLQYIGKQPVVVTADHDSGGQDQCGPSG